MLAYVFVNLICKELLSFHIHLVGASATTFDATAFSHAEFLQFRSSIRVVQSCQNPVVGNLKERVRLKILQSHVQALFLRTFHLSQFNFTLSHQVTPRVCQANQVAVRLKSNVLHLDTLCVSFDLIFTSRFVVFTLLDTE